VVCVRVAEHTSRPVYLRVFHLHEESLDRTDQKENRDITDYHINYGSVWNLKLHYILAEHNFAFYLLAVSNLIHAS
jgi:hypothetical protein